MNVVQAVCHKLQSTSEIVYKLPDLGFYPKDVGFSPKQPSSLSRKLQRLRAFYFTTE